jgi:hypothetical protein
MAVIGTVPFELVGLARDEVGADVVAGRDVVDGSGASGYHWSYAEQSDGDPGASGRS